MAFTKTKIYSLALSHLLLSRQVSDVDTDTTTNEVRVLNTFWEDAFNTTLQDLDLDSTSETVTLELLEKLDNNAWNLAYKYPTDCNFFRRIESCVTKDNRRTHIPKRVGVLNGEKVIYTNEEEAVAEIIPKNIQLEHLETNAGLAISYMLAFLAAPLIVGKGAAKLKGEIYQMYLSFKDKAQEIDERENFNYDPAIVTSEFVSARME